MIVHALFDDHLRIGKGLVDRRIIDLVTTDAGAARDQRHR